MGERKRYMRTAHLISDPAKMRDFVLGGRAYFTLLNTHTGGRVTYCVDAGDEGGTFVVRAFTGSDNSVRQHYSYLGSIKADGSYVYAGAQAAVDALLVAAEGHKDTWLIDFCKNIRAKLGRGEKLSEKQTGTMAKWIKRYDVTASPLAPDDVRAKGFAWFWRFLASGRTFPETFQFWHEGRCARCGRRLTVPDSIATGFGPECAAAIGLPQVQVSLPMV